MTRASAGVRMCVSIISAGGRICTCNLGTEHLIGQIGCMSHISIYSEYPRSTLIYAFIDCFSCGDHYFPCFEL